MFGLGPGEMVVIAALALLVIGPERLPRIMRTAGVYYGQLRRAADDLRRAFVLEADRQDAEERYKALKERRAAEQAKKAAAEAAPPPPVLVEDGAADEIVPNDIPPDAPHPDLTRRDP